MPTKISTIAKKLNVDVAVVLAKAKELEIPGMKSGESSLSRSSAKLIEERLRLESETASGQLHVAAYGDPPETGSTIVSIVTESPQFIELLQYFKQGVIHFQTQISESKVGAGRRKARISFTVGRQTSGEDSNQQSKKPLDPKLRKILRWAYKITSELDETEWVTLAEFGNAIKKLDATFDPRTYGQSSLRAVASRYPNVFEIRYDDRHTPPVPNIRLKEDESSAPTSDKTKLPTGKIHNIKESLGYGFVALDAADDNIYFHSSDVVGGQFTSLRAGDRVEFVASTNERGPCAKEVRKL